MMIHSFYPLARRHSSGTTQAPKCIFTTPVTLLWRLIIPKLPPRFAIFWIVSWQHKPRRLEVESQRARDEIPPLFRSEWSYRVQALQGKVAVITGGNSGTRWSRRKGIPHQEYRTSAVSKIADR